MTSFRSFCADPVPAHRLCRVFVRGCTAYCHYCAAGRLCDVADLGSDRGRLDVLVASRRLSELRALAGPTGCHSPADNASTPATPTIRGGLARRRSWA